jgi:ferrous iron transport protein B
MPRGSLDGLPRGGRRRGRWAPTFQRIAILGNVNVGKSTLFDRLCGGGGHAVNIPGSTLVANRGVLAIGAGAAPRAFRRHCGGCRTDRARSRGHHSSHDPCCGAPGDETACPALRQPGRGWFKGRSRRDSVEVQRPANLPTITHLYDTPGCGTLVADSEDEMVTRDLLLSGLMDAVLLVADAKNLRRSLALALQVAEFGLPMVLDLNMLDEAESIGVEVDDEVLAELLDVAVVRTIAVEGIGVRRLAEAVAAPRVPHRRTRFPDVIEDGLTRLQALLTQPGPSPRGLGLLLLAGDRGAEAFVASRLGDETAEAVRAAVAEVRSQATRDLDIIISESLHDEAERIVARTVTRRTSGEAWLVKLGSLAQQPFPGVLFALAVLVLAYYWVGAFGATFVADSISRYLFEGLLIPLCERLVAPIPSAFVRDALMDPDFGLLPTGLFLALGIVLPVLFCFYMFQAILEDSGYLPRLSVLFDRVFRWMGLNGQGLIPLVLGFSCVTMAVITTRMLPTRKERVVLTLLLILAVPCAPLIAVMFVVLDSLPWTASAVVFGIILSQTLLAGFAASRLLPGALPDLILEIPRMRIPRPRVVLGKTWRNTWQFMAEAVPVFLVASFVVFLFDRVGGLDVVERLSRPLTQDVLGLPGDAVQVFIKTAIRRESGATELNMLRDRFDGVQLVVTLVVMTFLVPCINSIIVIVKERGVKTSAAILATVVVWALAVGAATNWICRGLGVTFGG